MTLVQAFADQSVSCTKLGSPFMGQLLDQLALHWPSGSDLDAYFGTFSGDLGPAGASLPLRLAGGLHALVLTDQAPELSGVYPPNKATDADMRSAVLNTLVAHEGFLLDWVRNAPQTNEVRRSAALMAGAAVARAYSDLPVCLSELGASGGLNMMWDHLALALPNARLGAKDPVLTLSPEWTGALPPLQLPVVAARAGVDLSPLDPRRDTDLLRMLAYLWPDQPERIERTKAVARVVNAPIVTGDAIEWLATRLSAAPEGHMHLIQHTVAWQYFPPDAQDRGHALIEAAGAAATDDRPLAWLSMETDGDRSGTLGAALTLRFWPGDVTLQLGRADFHGRWIKWALG